MGVRKSFLSDVMYSTIAYAVPSAALLLIIQPQIAEVDPNEYGLLLTVLNLIRFLVNTIFGSLTKIRLIKDLEYKKKQCKGDFNIFMIISMSFSVIIIMVALKEYLGISEWKEVFFDVSILVLMGTHDYFSVFYRIHIRYKMIVVDNLIITVGYFIGLFLYLCLGTWQIVFISGYIGGCVFVICTTEFWKEKFRKTEKINQSAKAYTKLMVSNLFSSAIQYGDRLMIYPILGSHNVSVYNTAGVVSKVLVLITSPLNNVVLSYLGRRETITIHKKKLKLAVLISLAGIMLFYGFSYVVTIFFAQLLYPQWSAEAKVYIPIVLATIIIQSVGSILNTFLLRFASLNIQITLTVVRVIVYFSLSIMLMFEIDLWGICIGNFISTAIYLGLIIKAVYKNIKRQGTIQVLRNK